MARRRKTPEEMRVYNRERMRRWRAANREKVREQAKQWRERSKAADPEGYLADLAAKMRRRRTRNPSRVRQEDRNLYHRNLESRRAKQRDQNRREKERDHAAFTANRRRWREERRQRDPEGFRRARRVADQARRARELNAGGRGVTKAQWGDILDASLGLCAYCNDSADLTMDHMDPLARGGEHDVDNVVAVCMECNREKHTRTLLEYLVWRSGT